MTLPYNYYADGSVLRQLDRMVKENKMKVYVFYYDNNTKHYPPTLVDLIEKGRYAYSFTIPGEYDFVEPHDAWGFWISDSLQEATEYYNEMIDEYIKSREYEIKQAKRNYLRGDDESRI